MEPSFGKHECVSFGGYEKNYTSGINNGVKSSELLTARLPGTRRDSGDTIYIQRLWLLVGLRRSLVQIVLQPGLGLFGFGNS